LLALKFSLGTRIAIGSAHDDSWVGDLQQQLTPHTGNWNSCRHISTIALMLPLTEHDETMRCAQLRTRSRLEHVRGHIRHVIDIGSCIEKSCVLSQKTQRSMGASRHAIAKSAHTLHLLNIMFKR
jgi:hypothetical protein